MDRDRQRGVIQLNLIAYGLIALGLVAAIAAGIHMLKEAGRDEIRAEWADKNRQEKERQAREIAVRNSINDSHEAENATKVATLEDKLRRALLLAAGVRKPDVEHGEAPALSTAASVIACPDRQADAARRLEQLEVGVLALAARGDRAIIRTETCRSWLTEQMKVDVR